jgi:hypothetical protein
MTTLEQIKFAAAIQVGTEIKGHGNQILVVTSITEKRVYGYSKYNFEKYGKKTEMSLEYSTITNPHYNKGLSLN